MSKIDPRFDGMVVDSVEQVGTVPAELIAAFPELGDAMYCVVEIARGQRRNKYVAAVRRQCASADFRDGSGPGHCHWFFDADYKSVKELVRATRWAMPAVTDMSTRQLGALLVAAIRRGNCEIVVGDVVVASYGGFLEEALREMVRRSQAANSLKDEASRWLAQHFEDESIAVDGGWTHPAIDWLAWVFASRQRESAFGDLGGEANRWVRETPITGGPEQWGCLRGLPAVRTEVRAYEDRGAEPQIYLPNGENFSVRRLIGGGYFRLAEDGVYDLFLRRGAAEIGDKGLMWARVTEDGKVVAAVDPLHNYGGLGEFAYTPLMGRLHKALQAAVAAEQ